MAAKLMSILLDISEKSTKTSIKSKIEEIITLLESMLSVNNDIDKLSSEEDKIQHSWRTEETIRRGKDMVQDSLWELLSKMSEEESSLYEETLESVNYYLFN